MAVTMPITLDRFKVHVELFNHFNILDSLQVFDLFLFLVFFFFFFFGKSNNHLSLRNGEGIEYLENPNQFDAKDPQTFEAF
jgi:hypothetical protein